MSEEHRLDLLYLACNRLEFTQESFTTLVANTDWALVRELAVYDDGSRDGTAAWLAQILPQVPARTRLVRTHFASPVAAMNHFVERAQASFVAKIDNDVMLPPGWLGESLAVLDRHPELDLLGIEALYPVAEAPDAGRSYTPAPFVSGLGVYRRAAFAASRPVPNGRWYGFEEWQAAQGDRLGRGWINPALPVFLLDRVPLPPWNTYASTYVRRGWQRAWPAYDTSSTLWHWRWPPDPSPAKIMHAAGNARFLCALRVKNEAAHIQEVISRVLPLCGQVFVFDDHSTDATPDICRSFGARVTLFPSPFSGLDEARDKNFLLEKVIAAGAEWVLWIDGDEVLERRGPEHLRLAAERGRRVAAYHLRIAYLWNDAQHVRVDGIYGRFRRPSFFRLKGQPLQRLHFPSSGYGGNFHCGNVPRGLLGTVRDLPVRLKHYGYMTEVQRKAKYNWYTEVDPNNTLEDCYRHLAEIPGARYAPGPPQIVAWRE